MEEKVEVMDPGLRQVITFSSKYITKSFGRHAKKRFAKAKVDIVERLINKLAVTGHRGKEHKRTSGRNTGKYLKLKKIVEKAFNIIKQKGYNPKEILVKAIENASPREEVTTIQYGGIRYPKAVDVSPIRRVDVALRWLTQGAYDKAVSKKIRIWEALAEELILAATKSSESFAIKKKEETERQAQASR